MVSGQILVDSGQCSVVSVQILVISVQCSVFLVVTNRYFVPTEKGIENLKFLLKKVSIHFYCVVLHKIPKFRD